MMREVIDYFIEIMVTDPTEHISARKNTYNLVRCGLEYKGTHSKCQKYLLANMYDAVPTMVTQKYNGFKLQDPSYSYDIKTNIGKAVLMMKSKHNLL